MFKMKTLAVAAVVTFAGNVSAAGPTLTDVLANSDVVASGHIDAAYNYVEGNDQLISDFNRGSSARGFVLHQAALTLAKTPASGFGGLVNVTLGEDARVLNANGANGNTTAFNLTQAYGSWTDGTTTVIGGKFTSLAGMEVIASPGNINATRGLLFFNVPYLHTGVRVSHKLSDTVTVIGGLNNASYLYDTDGNEQSTVELAVALNPIKPLTVAVNSYYGREGNGKDTALAVLDVVANYAASDTLTLGLNADYINREDGVAAGTSEYKGIAAYVNQKLSPTTRIAGRAEYADNYALGGAGHDRSFTATYGYMPASNFELMTELRYDLSNLNRYDNGTADDLVSGTVKGVYRF